MPNSMSLENELLLLENRTWVIYIESSYNTEINDYIKSNYHLIFSIYLANKLNFLYLPYFVKSETFKSIVNYNYPYFKTLQDNIPISEINNLIIQKFNLKFNRSYLFTINSVNNELKNLTKSIDNNSPLFEQFYSFANENKGSFSEEENLSFYKMTYSDYNGSINTQNPFLEFIPNKDLLNPDEILTPEFNELLEKLRQKGSFELIDLIVNKLQNLPEERLSQLEITNDYKILLTDLDKKEVKLSPQARALYILYLLNEDGISFANLKKYKDELIYLYKQTDIQENRENDEYENIITKFIKNPESRDPVRSEIKKSFENEMSIQSLAKHYYITGKKGEDMKIILNRELIKGLKDIKEKLSQALGRSEVKKNLL